MNDKDRDRCSDGAGPVDRKKCITSKCHTGCMTVLFCMFCVLCLVSPVRAQSFLFNKGQLRGLSLTVGVGVFRPDNSHANFYNGNPNNVNTLLRILHSETYGNQIWNNLNLANQISDAVSSYKLITVAEYGDMYYRLAFQLGMGFRYDFDFNKWAWQIKFDYANLNAVGMVLLNSGKGSSYLTNQDRYVNCPTMGKERRIYIDLGIIRKFKMRNGYDIEFSVGGNVNNTKVESSDIQIGGVTYSILDIWGGQSPSSYTASYEYINQGGIGYGGYASVAFGFTLPVGTAMTLSYTYHYNKVNLWRYEGFASHHAIRLNVAINNFSLFG